MSECGTYAGYQRHGKRGERPCDDCREAYNAYIREYRQRNPHLMRRQDRVAKARRRALALLARRHPLEYRELYRDEVARLRGEAA